MPLFMACQSDADRMAHFCLDFEKAVNVSEDCAVMAEAVSRHLDAPQPKLRDRYLCEEGTACLPCREAVRRMLKLCGTSDTLRPVLDRMHFSSALQKLSTAAEP